MRNVFEKRRDINGVSIILNNGRGEIFFLSFFLFPFFFFSSSKVVEIITRTRCEKISRDENYSDGNYIFITKGGFKVSNLIIYRVKYI